MGLIQRRLRYLLDSDYRWLVNSYHGHYKDMPDEEYLKKKYRIRTGRIPDFDNPTRFTEKLQWIKLYDHNPLYTTLVDKYNVKKYVADTLGEEYVIPLLGHWDNVEDIDFDSLPDRFVMKASHDSFGLIICKDKSKLDIEKAKKKLKKCLNTEYFYSSREWPYKNVKPCILAEKFMEDKADGELRDYKFFCFNGVPRVVYITQGRATGDNRQTYADFFDMDYNHLDMKIDHEHAPIPPHKPVNFELMQELAAKLSAGIPQVRADFYEVDGRVYFGEMTFFHGGGFANFTPDSCDELWGSWIKLPEKNI